ncbi:ABC transporter ATP-binding protein [Solicola gregarius]|uniref:ABC transporter ATP-binding protein n=1 Tax=Solicola gregarius TaxID=2908642 RepID=A0AA46YJX8_9ACTN|nr:ABC transporter ATP-binding protein [Solicola gregarius]UYM03956.1 ABC transporter ATP-binding protein [Solicola gregarius]
MQLEIRGLTKRFGSLTANDHIDLSVEPGEIHCLLGENGAGKSTLMNMLYGLLEPDEGEILADGEPLTIRSPGDAIDAGIGMVHQHFMLVPVFTVAENIMLGHEQTGLPGVLSRRKAAVLVGDLSERYGLSVDPDAKVADVSVGVQQRVEILKALIKDAEVLILDEPTAVLTPQETDELFTIMRQLRDSGTSIVFITHKLREVRAIADRITVIRRGKVVATAEPSASESELAELMVGREVSLTVDRSASVDIGDPVLEVRDLTIIDERGHTAVDHVSLDVRAGEVLGLAGVQGNGQTEFVAALLGLTEPATGTVALSGTDIGGYGPARSLRAGIGFVPEDRKHDGFVESFTVAENLVLDLYRHDEFSAGLQLRWDKIYENADHRIAEFDIRTQGSTEHVGSLSGGNQQKVVLARELSRPLRLLVASQPTRGLDVGSIEFVHKRIMAERENGTAVLIVSTELDEIVGLSDRVAVMYGGRVAGIVPPDTPREELGLLMAGVTPEGARHV